MELTDLHKKFNVNYNGQENSDFVKELHTQFLIKKFMEEFHQRDWGFSGHVEVFLHDTSAGKVPVVVATEVDDFNKAISMIGNKGKPYTAPDAVGAMFLMKPMPCIILSCKPYSNCSAELFGMDEARWQEISYKIRLGHESFHHMTKMKYGTAENAIHDELLADFYGMYIAIEEYHADWFLRFMGLEEAGKYRKGGRLEKYLKEEDYDIESFEYICQMLRRASYNLEDKLADVLIQNKPIEALMDELCGLSIQEMASGEF